MELQRKEFKFVRKHLKPRYNRYLINKDYFVDLKQNCVRDVVFSILSKKEKIKTVDLVSETRKIPNSVYVELKILKQNGIIDIKDREINVLKSIKLQQRGL